MKEFTIENRNETFRVTTITPIEMLAIVHQLDNDNMEKAITLKTFCLEHIEVLINDKWVPVKHKDREVYFPIGIETDYIALNNLCEYVVGEVIYPAFTSSSK